MKKVIVVFIFFLYAIGVAELVDGYFTESDWYRTGDSIIDLDLNNGWVSSTEAEEPAWDYSSGFRNNTGSGFRRGFGQFFTTAMTGEGLVAVVWGQEDSIGMNRVDIEIYGFQNNSGAGISSFSILDLAIPEMDGDGNAVLLSRFSLAGGPFIGTSGWLVDFGSTGEYDAIGFRMFADADVGSRIGLDLVAFPVPEPATALLLGVGGFGAWLLRRNKKRSDLNE